MRTSLLLLLLLYGLQCRSQTDLRADSISPKNFKDFVLVHQQLWALNRLGAIKVFNMWTGDSLPVAPRTDSPIVAMNLVNDSSLVVATGGRVLAYDINRHIWEPLGSYTRTVHAIFFDPAGRCWLLERDGLTDMNGGVTYFPHQHLNHQIHNMVEWIETPHSFMDKEGNIWIGLDYGEWGGDLFIFSTKTRKFIRPAMDPFSLELNPIQYFFSIGEQVYVTYGLQHMAITGGILRMDRFNAIPVFESAYPIRAGDTGQYIGPAAFNPGDSCIYFYSQRGIYKGNPAHALNHINDWTAVVAPKLRWVQGRHNAVGSPMNVLKMEFTEDHTLVFLSLADGIGLYREGVLTFIR